MLDTMRAALEAQSLKHSVSRKIFCPSCGNVMDCRKAVEVTVSIAGKPVSLSVVCADCWEDKVKANTEGLASRACNLDMFRKVKPEVKTSDIGIDIIDGRSVDWGLC